MGVLVLLTFCGGSGDAVQNRESPDFRSPEVGRYGIYYTDLGQNAVFHYFS